MRSSKWTSKKHSNDWFGQAEEYGDGSVGKSTWQERKRTWVWISSIHIKASQAQHTVTQTLGDKS